MTCSVLVKPQHIKASNRLLGHIQHHTSGSAGIVSRLISQSGLRKGKSVYTYEPLIHRREEERERGREGETEREGGRELQRHERKASKARIPTDATIASEASTLNEDIVASVAGKASAASEAGRAKEAGIAIEASVAGIPIEASVAGIASEASVAGIASEASNEAGLLY